MPDVLAYGRSERVTEPGEHYTLPHTAAAMAAILDELGVERVDIVAHSYGTVITQQFALDYPHRVRKVVLTGSVFEQREGAGTEGLRAVSPYGLSKGLTADVFSYFTELLGMKLGKFVIPNPFGPLEEPRFTSYLIHNWFQGFKKLNYLFMCNFFSFAMLCPS